MRRAGYALLTGDFTVLTLHGRTPATPPANPPAAQAPAPGGRGAGRGGPQLVSPEVRPDRTVTLRFRAPNAKEVTVIGELDGRTHPMTRIGSAGPARRHTRDVRLPRPA